MSVEQLKGMLLNVIETWPEYETDPTWSSLLSYCCGVFGSVTFDMIRAVRELEEEKWF